MRRERGSDPEEGNTHRKRKMVRRKHGAEMDYECVCVRWGKLYDQVRWIWSASAEGKDDTRGVPNGPGLKFLGGVTGLVSFSSFSCWGRTREVK